MLTLIWWIVDLFSSFLNLVNSIVLFEFGNADITLLGFIGALIIVGVTVRLLMPKV